MFLRKVMLFLRKKVSVLMRLMGKIDIKSIIAAMLKKIPNTQNNNAFIC